MPPVPQEKRLYKVIFFNQGEVYEVYARQVSQGGLYGFVEVEDLVFGETTQVVVDPSEERLKREFAGVQRFFVPMHAVLRIDEVEKKGPSRITGEAQEGQSNVSTFPVLLYTPGGSEGS